MYAAIIGTAVNAKGYAEWIAASTKSLEDQQEIGLRRLLRFDVKSNNQQRGIHNTQF